MSSNRALSCLFATASLSVLLAACGGGGGPDAPPNPPPAAAPAPAPVPAPAPPPPVTVTSALTDVEVDEGQPASFTVGVATTLPVVVEWSRDNARINNQTGTTLTLPATTLADDGATFRARVIGGNNAPGGTGATIVDGGTARLTVNLAAPAAPAGLTLLAGQSGTSALLRWTDNANNETGFEAIRVVNGQDVVVATIDANQTTFTMSGLTPGAVETVRVRAIRRVSNRSATSAAASVTATMPGAVVPTPAAPTNARLAVVAGQPAAVDFSWDDESNNESGFDVFQVVNGSDVQIGVGSQNQTTIRVNGLGAGTTHTFRVRAFRVENGTTARSALASATITLPSAQGTVVRLNATQDNVVRVSTSDPAVASLVLRNVPVEVGCIYVIDFGVAGNGAVCSRSLVLFDVAALSGRTIRRAELRLLPVAGAVDFAGRTLRIGAIQQAWNPATVNAHTALTVSTVGVVVAPLSTLTVERAFDVTTIVARWASGAQANNGLGLALTDESIPGDLPAGTYGMFNSFASRENTVVANRPALVVEFE